MTESEKYNKLIKIIGLILDQLWDNGHKSNNMKKARRELQRLK